MPQPAEIGRPTGAEPSALPPASPPAAAEPADTALLAQLSRLMEQERCYREDGFSIATLATRMDLAEYRPVEVLDAVMATARPLAENKGLALDASVDGKIDACYGDGKRMVQVLLNLVGNAVKFTRRGRVEVGVVAANGHVHYTVKDTGIGIPPEQLDSIFEEFGQGDVTVTNEFGGTGLGLAIAKRFVTMQGGRIWAESTPEVGSTFHVVVPRRLTDAKEQA